MEKSNLLRRVKDLERAPHASEEDEEGAAEKAVLSTRAKKIIGLGRTYGYTMNMFISAKECTPSKVASCYDPTR